MKRILLLALMGLAGCSAVSRSDSFTTSTTLAAEANGCTTAGDTDCDSIFASRSLVDWGRVSITVTNDGANTLSDVLVEFSADNTNWELWDSTTFDELAAAATKSLQIGENSRKFIRLNARSASGTDVIVTLAVNNG